MWSAVGLAVLLALLAAPLATAQMSAAVQAFDEGNRFYQDGAYQDALTAYERALASGYASGALYANMGNAYFRLDELGQAIRYYEKARRLPPDDPRVAHNLTVARSRIATPISSLPTPAWKTWWKRAVVPLGALPFFIAGLLLYGVAAILLGRRIWTGIRNDWHRRALALSFLFGVLILAMGFTVSLDSTLDRQAVVIAGQAPLRETPDAAAASELDVPEGVLLDILGQQDAWLEVRLPNGITGWLRTEATAEV